MDNTNIVSELTGLIKAELLKSGIITATTGASKPVKSEYRRLRILNVPGHTYVGIREDSIAFFIPNGHNRYTTTHELLPLVDVEFRNPAFDPMEVIGRIKKICKSLCQVYKYVGDSFVPTRLSAAALRKLIPKSHKHKFGINMSGISYKIPADLTPSFFYNQYCPIQPRLMRSGTWVAFFSGSHAGQKSQPIDINECIQVLCIRCDKERETKMKFIAAVAAQTKQAANV